MVYYFSSTDIIHGYSPMKNLVEDVISNDEKLNYDLYILHYEDYYQGDDSLFRYASYKWHYDKPNIYDFFKGKILDL